MRFAVSFMLSFSRRLVSMEDFSNPAGRSNGIGMKMTGQKQKRLPGWEALTAVFGAEPASNNAHGSLQDNGLI
jgi:hypothetical protein